jgi:hypothetical protein
MTSRDWLILIIASVSLLASCWLSLVGTYAALQMRRAAKRLAISNGRTIEDTAHEGLLFAAGVCLHIPGLRVRGCACCGESDL